MHSCLQLHCFVWLFVSIYLEELIIYIVFSSNLSAMCVNSQRGMGNYWRRSVAVIEESNIAVFICIALFGCFAVFI